MIKQANRTRVHCHCALFYSGTKLTSFLSKTSLACLAQMQYQKVAYGEIATAGNYPRGLTNPTAYFMTNL